jgi:trimethylguanosine synthase
LCRLSGLDGRTHNGPDGLDRRHLLVPSVGLLSFPPLCCCYSEKTNHIAFLVSSLFSITRWGGINYLNSPEADEEDEENGAAKKKGNKKKKEAGKRRQHYYKLKELAPIDGHELFKRARQITERIIYYLPRHTDLHDLSKLAALFPANPSTSPSHKTDQHIGQKFVIEVEENWMNQKCKALTVYFGPLVSSSQPPPKNPSS